MIAFGPVFFFGALDCRLGTLDAHKKDLRIQVFCEGLNSGREMVRFQYNIDRVAGLPFGRLSFFFLFLDLFSYATLPNSQRLSVSVPPWKFLGRSAAKGTDKEVAMVLCIGRDIAMDGADV